METTNNKIMYKYLCYIFIIGAISISTSMLTNLPPEYNVAATALLLGGMGASHCLNLRKREELLDELEENVKRMQQSQAV